MSRFAKKTRASFLNSALVILSAGLPVLALPVMVGCSSESEEKVILPDAKDVPAPGKGTPLETGQTGTYQVDEVKLD